MAVSTEHDMTRLHIAGLRHKLMADAVAAVDIFDPVLFYKGITHTVMAGIVLLTGRYQVIVDQNDLVRIPDFLKSHLVKLVNDKRDHDVIEHDAVYIHRYDIARLHFFAGIM